MDDKIIEVLEGAGIPLVVLLAICFFLMMGRSIIRAASKPILDSLLARVIGNDRVLKLIDSFKEFNDDYSAAVMFGLYAPEIVSKFAKKIAGRYIPNAIRQLIDLLAIMSISFLVFLFFQIIASHGFPERLVKLFQCVLAIEIVLVILMNSTCMLFDVPYLFAIKEKFNAWKIKKQNKEVIHRAVSFEQAKNVARTYGGYCLVDVRSKIDYDTDGLIGSIHIDSFTKEKSKYRGLPIFLYSNYGGRSRECAVKASKYWGQNKDMVYDLGGIQPDVVLARRFAIELKILYQSQLGA